MSKFPIEDVNPAAGTKINPNGQNPAIIVNDPIDQYLLELEQTLREISREQIWEVTQVLFDAWRSRRTIFIIGNGGSAATASHMANDLNKLAIVPGKPRFKAIALTDNVPLMTAWGNDTSYDNIFVEQMLNFLEEGDIVIGISSSGNSSNVNKAVRVARESGAITIGFIGRDGGALKDMVHYKVLIPSDHIGQQEDGHMILDHVIANTIKSMIETDNEQIELK
jgi:D-sedoheptulose 7-phosphate isomerase